MHNKKDTPCCTVQCCSDLIFFLRACTFPRVTSHQAGEEGLALQNVDDQTTTEHKLPPSLGMPNSATTDDRIVFPDQLFTTGEACLLVNHDRHRTNTHTSILAF